MSDPVSLADPDLLLAAPLPSHHSTLHSSAPLTPAAASGSAGHDSALDDITDSFNLDYLTLQHNAEIEHIRSQQAKPRSRHAHSAASHPHRRRQRSSERALLEERCAMLERLLHKQSSEMEQYVNSTAQLYVKLSDQQARLHDDRRAREDGDKECDEWRSKAEQLERDHDRLKTEREREKDSNARLITALRREAADVRGKWVELEARHQQLTADYETHERRYTQRLEDLERQRQQWERQKAEAEEMREKLAQLKADNERLRQDAARVGQLTAELNGMQEIVDRLRAERVSFEVDRGAWAAERKEREKEIRGLVERLMKEELEVERAKLEAATLRQQLQDTQDTHATERQAVQQRLEQQRAEHSQRTKQLNEQLADTQLQLRLVKAENEQLLHPDHHENTALKQQLIAAMQQQAQFTQQLHSEELRRVERDGHDREKDRQLAALVAHRKRLIGRVWRERQRLDAQRWFYRWSGWIVERRKRRQQDSEQERKRAEEEKSAEQERKREKAGVDTALKELEEKMRKLETDRQRDDEKQRMREEVEEDARRKRRRQDELDEQERRMREAKNREKEERKEPESSDDEKRSPSRHRHRHTHYLSPALSPSPSLSPPPSLPALSLSSAGSQSYAPLLSALLSMRGAVSGGAAGEDELTARMEALLHKMNRLQQLEGHVTVKHASESPMRPSSAGAGMAEPLIDADSHGAGDATTGTELPIALLAPPMNAALLPPPPPVQSAHGGGTDAARERASRKRAASAHRAATRTRSSSTNARARPQSSPATASRTQRLATKQPGAPAAASSRKAHPPAAGMSAFIEHAVSQQRTRTSIKEGNNRRWGAAGRVPRVASAST